MDKAEKIAAYILAVCVAARAVPVYAHTNGKNVYSSKIPFKISDPNDKVPEDTVFMVKLIPVGDAPMPEVSEFEAKLGEKYFFGPIDFDEPGDYSYTISELAASDERIILDDRVYEADIAVFIEEDGSMWGAVTMRLQGSGKKLETAEFENDYRKILPPEDSEDSSETEESSQRASSERDSSLKESSEDESSREDSSRVTSSQKDSSRGESSYNDSSGDESSKADSRSGDSSEGESSRAEASPPDSGGSENSEGGGSDPPIHDSSGDTDSGTEYSGEESSDSGSGSFDSTASETEGSTADSSPAGGKWLGSLTSPNTGGKVAATLSGLMISAVIVVLGRRRTKHSDDDPGGGSS